MNVIFKATIGILIIGITPHYLNKPFANGGFPIENTGSIGDTIVKRFDRHGLLYSDIKVKRKLISRNVYLDDKIVYKYPVTKKNVGRGVIELLSGNTFLPSGVDDTIRFSSYSLPTMNRTIYLRGGQIRRISDSSYLVKSNYTIRTVATFVIAASDNYEEIKNRPGFIVDSLVLPIR